MKDIINMDSDKMECPCKDCIILPMCLQRYRKFRYVHEFRCKLLTTFTKESLKNLANFSQYMESKLKGKN